jgi:hypothetical protein
MIVAGQIAHEDVQHVVVEFYTKKLGLQILTDQPFGAQRWIELCVPGAETKLALFTRRAKKVAW